MMETSWKCTVCGYIHHGAEPPESCPICGVGRELFTAFETAPTAAPTAAPSPTAWRCTICDYVHEGPEPPATCPVCGAPAAHFKAMDDIASPTEAVPVGRRLVILGAGIAGISAALQARRSGADVDITVVSKEQGLPYYRLSLTPYLAGLLSDESLPLHPAAFYQEQRIRILHGEAADIDRNNRKVKLSDGRTLAYDSLILANGAHPFVPPILGAQREGVLTLRTRTDADELIRRAATARSVACIGGGLLGLEAAGGLLRRGARITVLEGFSYLLPRQLAKPAGERLARHLEGLGMTIRCGVVVKEIVGDEAVAGIKLESGEVIPADLVLVSTGVRPNSFLARLARLDVHNGVVVDDLLRSSDPAIFAAGDVAEHGGVVSGLWSAAYAQGRIAGSNAMGGRALYRPNPPSTRLKVLDVEIFSIGQFQPPDGSYQVLEDNGPSSFRRLVCRDGVIVGANLYGDTRLTAAVTEAIEQGTQIGVLGEPLRSFPGLAGLAGLGAGG